MNFGFKTAVSALSIALMSACANLSPDAADQPSITQGDLQTRLEALQTSRPDVSGFAIAIVLRDGTVISTATGVADPDGRAMSATTPVRIASITKTIVAASVLRLVEEEKLDLDAPASGLISPEHNATLTADGYDTDAITVRHLLMHSSGLNDHAQTDAFLATALSEPGKVWTRTDQIRVLAAETDRVGAPGEAYFYSDTGYLLLGEIIERTTGEPLSAAVRRLAKLDAIGLDKTWWDEETDSAGASNRAHQWLGEIDTYAIHGSLDAHGGGGLVANVEDVARFYMALFDGEVFSKPETLALMTSAPGRPDDSPYLMGLFVRDLHDQKAYGHEGFWGLDAIVIPDADMAVAGVALNQSGLGDLRALQMDILRAALGHEQ